MGRDFVISVFIVYRTVCATHGLEVRRCPTQSAKTLYTGNYKVPVLPIGPHNLNYFFSNTAVIRVSAFNCTSIFLCSESPDTISPFSISQRTNRYPLACRACKDTG